MKYFADILMIGQGEFKVNQYPPSAVVGLKNERAKNYEDLKQSIILNR